MSDEKTVVKNFGESNDELTALEILKNSTKVVKTDKNRICIEKTSNLDSELTSFSSMNQD